MLLLHLGRKLFLFLASFLLFHLLSRLPFDFLLKSFVLEFIELVVNIGDSFNNFQMWVLFLNFSQTQLTEPKSRIIASLDSIILKLLLFLLLPYIFLHFEIHLHFNNILFKHIHPFLLISIFDNKIMPDNIPITAPLVIKASTIPKNLPIFFLPFLNIRAHTPLHINHDEMPDSRYA